MESETSLIIDALRRPANFQMHDFFELEILQAKGRDVSRFVQKGCHKTLEVLMQELSKNFNQIIIDKEDLKNGYKSGKQVIVSVLDGLSNFSRSMPEFATMLTIVENHGGNIDVKATAMNFPASGDLYYSEKGKGAYVQKASTPGNRRLRISDRNDTNLAQGVCDEKHFIACNKFSQMTRIYGSFSYSLATLISGKSDIIFYEDRPLMNAGAELFVHEAAGMSRSQNDVFLAANLTLMEKV